jgi:hypothetical protein
MPKMFVEKSRGMYFLPPPERESCKKLISNGYFCGAYELWEVLTETINEKPN